MMTPERWQYTNDYLRAVFGREDPLLAELREAARTTGMPDIAVSADVGRLLQLLVRTTRARAVVELGTLAGYSALWMARALAPGGRLVTIELEPARADFARGWFERAGVADRVEVVVGPALERLPGVLDALGEVDVAFFDAVKTEYPEYFRAVRDRVAPGGLVLADNVLGTTGWWIDAEGNATRDAVDGFNRAVAADEGFDVAAVPIREGVLVARKR